ncbi:MAG: penicillin-binding protein 2 [Thermostichales cyanobacterium SZTDM-1c_bins_54]
MVTPPVPYRPTQRTVGGTYRAVVLLLLASGLLVGGLGARLAYLQLLTSEEHRRLADNNRIRLLPQPPERGRLLDRHGQLVAGSRLSHSVFLWPLAQTRQQWEQTLPVLANYLELPLTEVQSKLEQAGYRSPFPVRVLRNASPAIIIRLEEHRAELPGVFVQAETIRFYPHGDLAAHVLGYTGEITTEQLRRNPEAGYRLGDVVGQSGLEHLLEPQLRGQWGGQQVEVDARGGVLRILGEQPPQAGQTVQLTLDLELQRVAETSLANRKGAVVAMDPHTGAVLAMASYPTFDPNLFSSHISQAQWEQLQRQQFPFLNRSLRPYPPASTYKIITMAAGLEAGGYSPNTVLRSSAYINVAGWQFWDWNRAGFGSINFRQAMAYSSDTFFYQVALRTGPKALQEWSRRFGLGRTTGSGLLGESPGLVPDADWKRQRLNQPWFVGDTVNMSIGQGYMTATPLQMAVVTAAVANGGYRVRPHFVLGTPPHREPVGLSPTTLRALQEALRDVITYGTGRGVALPPDLPLVAGKSGTAEDPPRRSHAWFVCYAPYQRPEIVVSAFLENSGGGGSSQAGPICRAVMEAYFRAQQLPSPTTPPPPP